MDIKLKQIAVATMTALGVGLGASAIAQMVEPPVPPVAEPQILDAAPPETTTTLAPNETIVTPPAPIADPAIAVTPVVAAEPVIPMERATVQLTPSNDRRLKPLVNAKVQDQYGNKVGKLENLVVAEGITYAVVGQAGASEDLFVPVDTAKLGAQATLPMVNHGEAPQVVYDTQFYTLNVATPESHGP